MPAALIFEGSRLPDSGSLVGDTIAFKHMETCDTAFTITSSSVSIVTPGGILTPSITTIPGSSSKQQVLQALVAEATAGEYTVNWTINVDGQIILRQEYYFISWTDIYTQVRRLLRVDETNVTNIDIDFTLQQIIRSLVSAGMYQDVLPSYDVLIAADRQAFDRAVALMSASVIRPWVPKQEAVGDVLQFQSGTDVYKWSTPSRGLVPQSIEEQWMQQAWEQLCATSTIGDPLRAMQDGAQVFALSGRRRQQVHPFSVRYNGEVWRNPLFLRWTNWYDSAAGYNWSWRVGGKW